ncbi:MAG: valine--tRNA ligase [Gemmataceae bacterium]|jgi:valyl-tRNA synthetase|nr:valine--tRNA ligase [Gemmataceae bacterium]
MPIELPKAYDPKEAQQKWLDYWDEKGYFRADPTRPNESYTIVIPPPNVTGALHMGHALNNTLQDILIRWRRMQGRNTLWVPGTDHAGIATQAVVERLLLTTEKKTRHDLGREAMVAKIWEWKDKYEKRILGQLREIGASCDWSRTRFTLDPICARAVRETFFRMFKEGYIYRGKRLVNWDAQLQTSVADDETYTEVTKGGFWTFQYPVIGENDIFIRFSTTRPETMLGDTALCVHPNDERYKHLVGKKVRQPHTGREIPIIADGQLADPELGTGCVKVTPAHDPNDYACWLRHPEIEIINILNPDGTIASGFGEYSGMDRAKAREAVTKKMEEWGLFVEKTERDIPLPFSDRSKTPIEPFLSDQWFVKMGDWPDGSKKGLAQLAIEAVTSGQVKFFPERYAKTYLDWLGEKRDWCISRQLWWGHQIPIWYKDELAPSEPPIPQALQGLTPEQLEKVSIQYQAESKRFVVCVAPHAEEIEKRLEADGFLRDPDVLDTWFSSALWPHSTLGWPESTPELQRYYPTSTLCTSRDIITLWVARMVLTGLYNVGKIPFHHVYVHPKILDGFGETMSKSKGNGLDPLDIVEIYGTDAMRYGMAAVATETQDSRLPVVNVCPHCGTQVPVKQEHMYMRTKKLTCPQCKKAFRPGGPWPTDDPELPTAKQASDRFEIGRNFANKLWNATRFILMNLEGYSAGAVEPTQLAIEDRWIVSRLTTTARAVTEALEAYKFAEVAKLIYDFAWSEFCDWYIEMSKSRRSDPICQRVLVGVLDGLLRLVHPLMPFVSESLWHYLNEAAPQRGLPSPQPRRESVCIAEWPTYPASCIETSTEVSIARMQELVRGVREIRNRYMIDDKTALKLTVRCDAKIAAEFEALTPFIKALAGIETLNLGPNVSKPKQPATQVHPEFEAYISLEGLIDIAAELKRLEKQIAEKRKQLSGIQNKLNNADFVAKAPADVVASQRELVGELGKQIALLESTMSDLQGG